MVGVLDSLEEIIKKNGIWENDHYILQIDKMYKSYRVVIFTKTEGILFFVGSVFYRDMEKFKKFLDSLGAIPTSKKLWIK